jgi:hypothetical protein
MSSPRPCGWALTLLCALPSSCAARETSGPEDAALVVQDVSSLLDAATPDAAPDASRAVLDAPRAPADDGWCTGEVEDAQGTPLGALGYCCEERVPAPAPRTTLDLRGHRAGDTGTCGDFPSDAWPYFHALELPGSPDAYPLRVLLPALTERDPSCRATCDGESTAFGVALDLPDSLGRADATLLTSIRVEPPWRVVSGGRGEASAWPCLDGYQEFGVASCLRVRYTAGFGFAIAEVPTSEVEAIIDIAYGEPASPACCRFEAPSP